MAPRSSNEALSVPLLDEYASQLSSKAVGTVDAYMRALRQFVTWVADRPGSNGEFKPEQFTRTAVETYLTNLAADGYSVSHRARVKSAASGFAQWLMEEKELLRRNPTRGVEVPAQPLMAPRQLSPDQRYVLHSLVERDDNTRSEAMFALGYWVGCRVSDVAWLRVEHTHVGPKIGWLHIGHKGGKGRDVDLINEARKPLHAYLNNGGRDRESPYVFTSQRGERLTEAGIHHWFRALRARATKAEWDLIHTISFHDLRHDFAHRAREAGWSLEEIAYYLGHITKKGTPAIQTTARYTQVSREQVREKLRQLRG
jgi:site-specific recombinase XerD